MVRYNNSYCNYLPTLDPTRFSCVKRDFVPRFGKDLQRPRTDLKHAYYNDQEFYIISCILLIADYFVTFCKTRLTFSYKTIPFHLVVIRPFLLKYNFVKDFQDVVFNIDDWFGRLAVLYSILDCETKNQLRMPVCTRNGKTGHFGKYNFIYGNL